LVRQTTVRDAPGGNKLPGKKAKKCAKLSAVEERKTKTSPQRSQAAPRNVQEKQRRIESSQLCPGYFGICRDKKTKAGEPALL
jgi:hypothetical protein